MSLVKKYFSELKHFFDKHPTHQVVHLTADGQKFYSTDDAINHGRTLPNSSVATITRNDVDTAVGKEEATTTTEDKEAGANTEDGIKIEGEPPATDVPVDPSINPEAPTTNASKKASK